MVMTRRLGMPNKVGDSLVLEAFQYASLKGAVVNGSQDILETARRVKNELNDQKIFTKAHPIAFFSGFSKMNVKEDPVIVGIPVLDGLEVGPPLELNRLPRVIIFLSREQELPEHGEYMHLVKSLADELDMMEDDQQIDGTDLDELGILRFPDKRWMKRSGPALKKVEWIMFRELLTEPTGEPEVEPAEEGS